MMRGIQTHSAVDVARELDICWEVHRIVWDQLDYREVCLNWVPKNPTDDDKAHCMGLYGPFLYPLAMLHWSNGAVLKLKHGWLHKTWNQKKDVIENLSTPSSKENGNVISKDDHEKLSWDHNCACFGFPWPWWHCGLSVIVVHLGTTAIFCNRRQLLRQSIVLLHENPRHYTPNLKAVYGCTSDRLWISPNLVLSILYLTESLRSTWLASDCNRCWCEASYHLLATDTQQQCLTLEYKPWYHCGTNAKMIVVTTVMSDVYHLLHVFHVLIRVTVTFWHEIVCYPIFWKFFVHTLQSELVNS